jgi:hypothetical protein
MLKKKLVRWWEKSGVSNPAYLMMVSWLVIRQYKAFTNMININRNIIPNGLLNNYVLWDITPCSPLKVKRHFGRACHLHIQG